MEKEVVAEQDETQDEPMGEEEEVIETEQVDIGMF